MTFIAQMIALGLAGVMSVLVNTLDYDEMNPAKRVRWRRGLTIATLTFVSASVVFACLSKVDADDAADTAAKNHITMKAQLDGADQKALAVKAQLDRADQRATVAEAKLDKLQASLDPVLATVKERHPGITDEQALARLDQELRAVKEQTNRIEQRTSQRRLSKEQVAKFASILRGTSRSIQVLSDAGDREGTLYGNAIADALRAAGWSVNRADVTNPGGPSSGLYLRFSTDAEAGAMLLAKAFVVSGMTEGKPKLDGGVDATLPAGSLILFVGSKAQLE